MLGQLSRRQILSLVHGKRLFSSKQNNDVIPVEEARRFIIDSMVKVGVQENHSTALADVLVAADYRGHFSHGMNRLEMYVNDILNKICDGNAIPSIVKENVCTALVDGKNGLGPVVGNFSMKGLSFTNTSPLQTPTRAKAAALGTNPLTVAAPAKNGETFFLDMATTAVALGKIEIQNRKNEPLPEGWAIDKSGKVTTDGRVAMQEGCLLPLGGTEINSGYKGYGLAFMVELFCGILSGSDYGPKIRRWLEADRPANLGQCFIAVDPNCFAPGFSDRLQDMMDFCRNMEPTESSKPVLVAGDPEKMHMDKVNRQGGITYLQNQIDASAALAEKLGVDAMKSVIRS